MHRIKYLPFIQDRPDAALSALLPSHSACAIATSDGQIRSGKLIWTGAPAIVVFSSFLGNYRKNSN